MQCYTEDQRHPLTPQKTSASIYLSPSHADRQGFSLQHQEYLPASGGHRAAAKGSDAGGASIAACGDVAQRDVVRGHSGDGLGLDLGILVFSNLNDSLWAPRTQQLWFPQTLCCWKSLTQGQVDQTCGPCGCQCSKKHPELL